MLGKFITNNHTTFFQLNQSAHFELKEAIFLHFLEFSDDLHNYNVVFSNPKQDHLFIHILIEYTGLRLGPNEPQIGLAVMGWA